jgi:hypothetical protein
MMKSLLAMPVKVHSGFLQACPLTSREYVILKNSLVQASRTGQPRVEILCDHRDVTLLLDRAKNFYPDAMPYIEKALLVSQR